MQFKRDIGNAMGYSKFNKLAIMCAKYDHRSKFYDAESTEPFAVQCGDGRIIAPDGYEKKPHINIFHDWNEKYLPVFEHATKNIVLGTFYFPRACICMASYPLEDWPCLPLDTHYDALIAGIPVMGDAMRPISEEIFRFKGTKHFATYDNGGTDEQKGFCRNFPTLQDGTRFITNGCSESLLNAYYRSAKTIFHVGSGNRGYLHALAVKYCKDVHTVTGDNNFEPTSIKDFLDFLYK